MPASSPQMQPDDSARWSAEGCPFSIVYSLQVLEELRAYGEEWFQKIPHGGMEVGAALFGGYDDGVVRVLEWRPIACEHSKGPGFNLSEKDLSGIERLLESCSAAPELHGLKPVGWFHTHTRSALFLSADDCAVFDRYFPDPWSVSLVFRYTKGQAVTAGFFYRELGGSVRGEKTAAEFEVAPSPAMALRPKRKSAAPMHPKRRVPEPIAQAPARRYLDSESPAPESSPEGSLEKPQLPAWDPSVLRLPDGEPEKRSGLFWKIPLAAAVLAALGLVGWLAMRPVEKVSAAALRVEPYDDQLLVLWDRDIPAVREAERGVMEIRDGDSARSIELDMMMARRGSVTYVRRSGDVSIELKLFKGGGQIFAETTKYVGQPALAKAPPPPPGIPAAAPPSQRELETRRVELKRSIAAQQARGKRLADAKKRPRRTAKRRR